MANTLYEYYSAKGQSLPPITERAKLFEQLGLGSASSYIGSYSQNVSLLSKLTASPGGAPPTAVPPTKETADYPKTSEGLVPVMASGVPIPKPTVAEGGATPSKTVNVQGFTIDTATGEPIDPKTGLPLAPVGTPAGKVLTPEQIKQYYAEEGNKANPLSPLDWLAKQGGGEIPTGTDIVSTSDQVRDKTAEEKAAEEAAKAKTITDQTTEITTLTNQQRIAELKKSLGLDVGAPAVPSFTSVYESLRSEQGIAGLESSINALNTTIADAEASVRQGLYNEEGQLRPMELIGTRQREIQRQGQELLDSLNRDKQTLVDELNTKNTMISNIMQLQQTDYANARNAYDTNFSQNLQLLNFITGQDEAIKSDAQANLTTILNMVKDSGKTFTELDPTLQSTIQNLEMKAGMPQGVTQYFMSMKPAAEVLAQITGTDANGNDIVTFIYKDPVTGMPGTSIVMPTGGVSGATATAAATEADWEQARQFIADNPDASFLDLKSYIQQYTKLNETEINTLLSQSGIVEKETPMSTDTMKSTLASLIISYGADTAARQIQGRSLTFTDSSGKAQTVTISAKQATAMMNLANSDPTLQDIMNNPTNYKITDKGVYKLRKFWPDQLIYKF